MGTRARDFSRLGGGGGAGGNVSIESILPYLTTANVVELLSANLYFTNARVFANIQLASINILADVDTASNVPVSGDVLSWDATSNVWVPRSISGNTFFRNTDDLPEGNVNLYYTNARVRSAVGAMNPTIIYDINTGLFSANVSAISQSANTTDAVQEGFVNKYFTNARVFANLQEASIGDLRDVDFTFFPPANNKVLVYSDSSNTWIAGDYFAERAFSAIFAEEANIVLSLGNHNTDGLVEGNTNLYFSNDKVFANIQLASLGDLRDVDTTNVEIGRFLGWTGVNWEPLDLGNVNVSINSSVAFAELSNIANIALRAFTADNVQFANTALFAQLAEVANSALTTNFAENSNLAQRAIFAETANTVLSSDFANTVLTLDNFTTDDLREGNTNLYFTDERAFANLQQASIGDLRDVDTSNAIIGDLLIYDGTNWVSSNAISDALTSEFAENANVANTVLSIANFTTDDLTEGANNFYYTANRVADDIQNILFGKDISLDDLVVVGNLTVQGSAVTLDVDTFEAESKRLVLARLINNRGGADGSGIVINGANLELVYSDLYDSLSVNKGLVIAGNLMPAVGRQYNIGSQATPWKGLYISGQTLFLGNLSISEGLNGQLVITDTRTNEAAGADFANVVATETVTVDRILGNVTPEVELRSYIGGNLSQFVTGTTGNLYLGILKDGDSDKFSGVKLVRRNYDGANVATDVIISNDKEGVNDSVARLSILGDGNVDVLGNVTVNGETLVEIARRSLSNSNPIISEYSNTYATVDYNTETGVITVNKDGVYEATAILTITEDWQDTPIKAAYIPTGTYIVQIKANDSAVGGGHTNEYYSGVMSWYSDNTDSVVFDEIVMHRAGAGVGSGTLFLRVIRTETADTDDLKLQVAGTTTNSGVSSYTFKFRRLL